MIGIGVTTYKRPEVIKLWLKQYLAFTPKEFELHIATDTDRYRAGIAKNKNRNLRQLMRRGCDHIFLFDDDCFPKADKWWEPFMEGPAHMMYLTNHNTDLHRIAEYPNAIEFDKALGCMLYQTREVIEKVGGFDEQFKLYGYEHIDYSTRIYDAGLTPGKYLTARNVEDYIYSMDTHGIPEQYLKTIPNYKGHPLSSVHGERLPIKMNENLLLTQTKICCPLF